MSLTEEQAFKKRQLERLVLLALQRFERDTGCVVRGIQVVEGDVLTHAQEQQHVITDVKLKL